LLCFVLAGIALAAIGQRSRVASAVRELRTAQVARMPPILDLLRRDQWFAPDFIRQSLQTSVPGSRDELVYRLALLSHDPQQVSPLAERLLIEPLPMVDVLATEMSDYQSELTPQLWDTLNDLQRPTNERLRAAFVLAQYDPPSGGSSQNPTTNKAEDVASEGETATAKKTAADRWAPHHSFIVDAVLRQNAKSPQDFNILLEQFEPAKNVLIPGLAEISRDPAAVTNRMTALGMLIHYLREDKSKLLRYALDATEDQFEIYIPELTESLPRLESELRQYAAMEIDDSMPEEQFDRMAARKATAAALLHQLELPELTWSMLKSTPMPHARTYLIHRAPQLGARFEVLLKELVWQSDPSIRQAMILMLGQFDFDEVDPRSATEALREWKQIFENDPDISVHSAARWALCKQRQTEWVRQTIDQ